MINYISFKKGKSRWNVGDDQGLVLDDAGEEEGVLAKHEERVQQDDPHSAGLLSHLKRSQVRTTTVEKMVMN